MPSFSTESIVLTCVDGVKLSGQRYRTAGASSYKYQLLCWHGWLDNNRSFYHLAPSLIHHLQQGVDLVALDFPGHGKSSHKSLDGASTLLMDYVYYVHDAIHQLGWKSEQVILIGHSMGGAVGLMYAAAFPISKLVLLDSLGPREKPTTEVAETLRNHVKTRLRGKRPCSIYPSLEEAVQTRCATPNMFPGNQYISEQAANKLVVGASCILNDGQLQFLHDQRLHWPSIVYLSKEHREQLYREVASQKDTKACVLLAKDGWPFGASYIEHATSLLQPQICETLPGSHHFHMDPDTANGVAEAIANFLSS